jgi:hypothetical protein
MGASLEGRFFLVKHDDPNESPAYACRRRPVTILAPRDRRGLARGMGQSGSASALGGEGLRLKAFVKNKNQFLRSI